MLPPNSVPPRSDDTPDGPVRGAELLGDASRAEASAAEGETRRSHRTPTMKNLAETARELADQEATVERIEVPARQVALDTEGQLRIGDVVYPLSNQAAHQLWQGAGCPESVRDRMSGKTRAAVFEELFSQRVDEERVPGQLRLMVGQTGTVEGYTDASLIDVRPSQLVQSTLDVLPEGLSAEEVLVGQQKVAPTLIALKCYVEAIQSEPRKGDVVYGGIDLLQSLTDDGAIQVKSYLHRLACSNGAIVPVLIGEQQARIRRLPHRTHTVDDVCHQVRRVADGAWRQLEAKLGNLQTLLQHPPVTEDFVRGLRTRYSLNEQVIGSVLAAMEQDEMEPTGSQYDFFNALSRIATHHFDLEDRMQRRLMDAAGEWSQRYANQCGQCGQWVERRPRASA